MAGKSKLNKMDDNENMDVQNMDVQNSDEQVVVELLSDGTEVKVAKQRIRRVPLELIKMGPYQRRLCKPNVNKIAKNFNPAKLGVLVVSYRDGVYYILDGQHRLAALRTLGYTYANCIVLEGMTEEQEAYYFCHQNDNKRSLTAMDTFKAALLAGDEACVQLNEIAKQHGFQIDESSKPMHIRSVTTLMGILQKFGASVLGVLLASIAMTWPNELVALRSEMLAGLAEFWRRYNGYVSLGDFEARMGKKKAEALFKEGQSMVPSSYATAPALSKHKRYAYCSALVETYNKRIKLKSNKLVLNWDFSANDD